MTACENAVSQACLQVWPPSCLPSNIFKIFQVSYLSLHNLSPHPSPPLSNFSPPFPLLELVGARLVAATAGAGVTVMAARTSSGGLDGRRSRRGGSVSHRSGLARIDPPMASDGGLGLRSLGSNTSPPSLPRLLLSQQPEDAGWQIRPGQI